MDVLEFVKERSRMCSTYPGCKNCPLATTACMNITNVTEQVINIVKKWSAEHPHKTTRQSLFIHQHPKVAIYDGVISIRPCQLEEGYTSPYCLWDGSKCVQCRKEYWLQEVD